MRISVLRNAEDKLYYFQFLSDSNQVVLTSQGYQSEEACEAGARAVIQQAGNPDRYESVTDADGQNYFILRTGNNQEIGRSVSFADANALQAGMTLMQSEGAQVELNPYQGENKDDDYQPLAFYEGRVDNTQNGFSRFQEGDQYYFAYLVDGRVILISEGYTSARGRDNGIASVERNMSNPDRYENKIHPNGKYYFNLKAGNNQEIATSRWFEGVGEAAGTIGRLTGATVGETRAIEGSFEEGASIVSAGANYQASISIADAPLPPTEPVERKKRKKRKSSKPKAPKAERVYLKSGAYLFNDVTYQTFISSNGKYYYLFKDLQGKTLFFNHNVRGFNSEEEVDAAVEKAMQFGPSELNYEGKMARNGKYYFYLNDGEGNRIGKSFFYNTAEDMQQAVGLLIGRVALAGAAVVGTGVGETGEQNEGTDRGGIEYEEAEVQTDTGRVIENGPAVMAEAGITHNLNVKSWEAVLGNTGRNIDEYLPCEAYQGEAGFHKFTDPESGEYYFAYNRDNGEIFLRSEGYKSAGARDNGIASVIKNAAIESRWNTKTTEEGKHVFILRAGNNQEIARSCPYDSEAAMMTAFAWIKGEESPIGVGSALVGGTLLSAAMIRQQEAEKQAAEAARLKAEKEEAELKAREEAARLKAEEKRKAAEEAARLAAIKEEEERRQQAEAARAKAEEEKRQAEAEKARLLALKAEEEQRKAAEEEARLAAIKEEEDRKQQAEAARAKAEEEKRQAEAEKARLLALKAEEEKRKAAEEEARIAAIKAEEKARLQAEKEARLKAEEQRKEEERLAAAAAAAAAASTTSAMEGGAAYADTSYGDSSEETVVRRRGWGWWPWLLLALLGLLLLFFLLRGCGGCGVPAGDVDLKSSAAATEEVSPATPEVAPTQAETAAPEAIAADTIETETPEPTVTPEPETARMAAGPDAGKLGFRGGSIEGQMANYLSDPTSTFPKSFSWEGSNFPFNSERMDRAALPTVDRLAALMKAYPGLTLNIYGHIDNTEDEIYTGPYGDGKITLSEIRARCLYRKLIERGISASRLTFKGFADQQPLDAANTRTARQKNRRLDVELVRR